MAYSLDTPVISLALRLYGPVPAGLGHKICPSTHSQGRTPAPLQDDDVVLVMPRELIYCVVSVYERYNSLTTSCCAHNGS